MNTMTPVSPLLAKKRRRGRLRTLVLAIALSPAAMSRAQDDTPPAPGQPVRIEPDARYQATIEAIARAAGKEQLDARLDELKVLVGGDHAAVMQQALHYLAHAKDPRDQPAVGLILKRLEVPAHSAVAVLAPQMANVNTAISGKARELLRHYEDRSASRPPDFSSYRAFVEARIRAGGEPSFELVRFMYESDPGVALLTLVRGYRLREPAEIRPILWAEHVVADLLWRRQHGFLPPNAVEPGAVEQLNLLSRHRAWWVRAYVVEVLCRHSELRTAELIERLKEDQHPRIRAEASSVAAEPDPIIDENPPADPSAEDSGRR